MAMAMGTTTDILRFDIKMKMNFYLCDVKIYVISVKNLVEF